MADSTVFRTSRNSIGRKKGIVIAGPSRTKQCFKDECDMNRIMARYEQTGQIDHLSTKQPYFGDFTIFSDYQTMLNKVNAAADAFSALPSELRKELDYRPENLVTWLQNPENRPKAEKYGILTPRPVEKHNIQGSLAPKNEEKASAQLPT